MDKFAGEANSVVRTRALNQMMSTADAEIVQNLHDLLLRSHYPRTVRINTVRVAVKPPHPLSMAQYPLVKTFLVAAWLEVERPFSVE
jgi:hypothetical protein